jgi:vacuolar-type H+-ATPase subunit I/STV1
MADEQAPIEGTPEPANTPDQGTGTQEQSNWQERYEHLQPEFTRATQDRDRYRQEAEQTRQLVAALQAEDPQVRQQAAEALGLQLIDEPEDDTQSDPNEQLARELAELKQWRDEFTGSQQQEQYVAQIEQSVEQQLDQLGDLSEPQKDWIVSRAIALPPTQDGLPDIQAAHTEFQALINAEKQSWAKSKPRSAFTSAAGQEATQVPDLDKHENRVDYMLSRLQADQT